MEIHVSTTLKNTTKYSTYLLLKSTHLGTSTLLWASAFWYPIQNYHNTGTEHDEEHRSKGVKETNDQADGKKQEDGNKDDNKKTY